MALMESHWQLEPVQLATVSFSPVRRGLIGIIGAVQGHAAECE